MSGDLLNPTVMAGGLAFPESPRWKDGSLWFVDGPALRVLQPGCPARVVCEIDCPLLIGVCFTPEGDVLVGDPAGRKIYRVSPHGKVSQFADLTGTTDYFINEMMMLADGSVIVDDVGFDLMNGAPAKAARLICISANKKRIYRTGAPLTFANGLALTDGGTSLFVAEHSKSRIWRFKLVPDEGLDQGMVVCTVPTDGLDGIALSKDGSIWYADANIGSVFQMSRTGQTMRSVATGYRHATSCVLNDEESVLFVTVVNSMPSADLKFANDGAVLAVVLDKQN